MENCPSRPGTPENALTLLGLDYGRKRIGVAVGQTVTRTASPLTVLNVVKRRPDWDALSRLIRSWRPDALVVGLPLRMDGKEQPLTGDARRFMRQLQGRYGLPVYGVDERLSTSEARGWDRARRAALDAVAAQVILEAWLGGAAAELPDA